MFWSLVLALMLATVTYPAAARQAPPRERLIVVFDEGVRNPHRAARDIERRHGGDVRIVYEHALVGFAGVFPHNAVEGIERDRRVAYVELDGTARALGQVVPTGVDRVEVDANATATIDGVDARVDADIAVIDTGIDVDHEDLHVHQHVNCTNETGGPPWQREVFCDGSGDDDNGHGTHVAGTAAAIDNGVGVVGVAPGARLWGVKVLDSSGRGKWSWVIAGVDYVAAHAGDIEVANMSLGGQGYRQSLRDAIVGAVDAGVVFAVAAGNESDDVYGSDGALGTDDDRVPAAYPEVAAVSALADSDGQPGGLGDDTSYGPDDSFASFSNYSRSVVTDNPVSSPGAAVDLILPGVAIVSTYNDGGYRSANGTSMASPHAAGLAALHVAVNGRAATAGGVATVRQALIDAGQDQASGLRLAQPHSEPDSEPEPLGWAGSSDTPPAVTLTNPEDGATVSSAVTVTADASDDDAVAQVEFFVDAVSIGIDADGSDGWSGSWDTAADADGSRTVSATATDTAAQTATDSITVTVDNVDDPPVVAMTNPREGATVSSAVTVTADASDDDAVAQVEFFVDAVSIGIDADGSDGWSASWDTAADADGSRTVSATATDTAAQTATDSITVTVDNSAPDTVHVGDLDGRSTSEGSQWTGEVTVTIHDASHTAVSDSVVSFSWSSDRGDFGTQSCTTTSGGTCTVAATVHKNRATLTFDVTDVAHDAAYEPSGNHDPDGDSDGTSITLAKP